MPLPGGWYGAPGGTRTHGLLLRRQTLYPLSYGRAVLTAVSQMAATFAATRLS
jgi:hypothetical protein